VTPPADALFELFVAEPRFFFAGTRDTSLGPSINRPCLSRISPSQGGPCAWCHSYRSLLARQDAPNQIGTFHRAEVNTGELISAHFEPKPQYIEQLLPHPVAATQRQEIPRPAIPAKLEIGTEH
jgi:hypothetical protein